MMNLIKVLVPLVGLVAASNHTNGTTSTMKPSTAAATTTVKVNTTTAAGNTTTTAPVTKAGNDTKKVTVDVPVTMAFKGVKSADVADKFSKMSKADIASISARRQLSNSTTVTSTVVKKLLIAAAKGFATAIGGTSATKKVTIASVVVARRLSEEDGRELSTDNGVKITFRVTMTGKDATAAAATALEAKVKDTATFKKALQSAVEAEVKKDTSIAAFAPTVKKIDAPVTVLGKGVTTPVVTTTASSGAMGFIAPMGAMFMAMFALF